MLNCFRTRHSVNAPGKGALLFLGQTWFPAARLQPTYNICYQSLRLKSGTSSRRWTARQMDDRYSKQSKQQGFRSRAAHKLLELDQKFRVITKGTRSIVDLGFAPGAWTQVALARLGALGARNYRILGVDLIDCSPPEGSHFIQGDIFSKKTHAEIMAFFEQEKVDLVLSDMMANTSGIKDNDHYASMDLCDGVVILANSLLKKNGNLVMKFYTGKEDHKLQKRLEIMFRKVIRAKPDACRDESREMYFVGLKKKHHHFDVKDLLSEA